MDCLIRGRIAKDGQVMTVTQEAAVEALQQAIHKEMQGKTHEQQELITRLSNKLPNEYEITLNRLLNKKEMIMEAYNLTLQEFNELMDKRKAMMSTKQGK